MSKITVEHLQRIACVYVRQSTPDQLVHNLESQRRQYGLADRARHLGWTAVEIIDDDRAEASPVRASNGCWPRSATVVSAPCSRSRLRVSPATDATGTR